MAIDPRYPDNSQLRVTGTRNKGMTTRVKIHDLTEDRKIIRQDVEVLAPNEIRLYSVGSRRMISVTEEPEGS